MKIELWERDIPWEKLEEEWESLWPLTSFQHPFLTPTWYKVWFNHFGNPPEVKLLLGRKNSGNLLGLGFLQESNYEQKKKISLLGSIDVWDYRDFIIAAGEEKAFFEQLIFLLGANHWSILELQGISEFSPTLKVLLPILEAQGWAVFKEVEEVALYLDLPSSWAEFLANLKGKERHELRRKLRRLEKEGDFTMEILKKLSPAQEEMEKFFNLHRKSRKDKAEFMTPQMEKFFRDLANEFQKKGWLELSFLRIKGEEAAAFFSFDFQDSKYLYNSGYDPDFGRLSPGILLAAFSIQEAIKNGKKKFNLLRGREDYKYRLGGKEEKIYRIRAEKR